MTFGSCILLFPTFSSFISLDAIFLFSRLKKKILVFYIHLCGVPLSVSKRLSVSALYCPKVQSQAMPALLWNDGDLMSRVARRLIELGEDQGDDSGHDRAARYLLGRRGKKNGFGRVVEDVFITEIDWLHLNVYQSPELRSVRCNELNLWKIHWTILCKVHTIFIESWGHR